jgi:hypothetical protein
MRRLIQVRHSQRRLLANRTRRREKGERNAKGPAIRLFLLALAILCVPPASADVCTVPSAPHPSIQAAVDDGACTEIVLAAQVFSQSVAVTRSLVLRGDSSSTTVIRGQVTVTGGTTEIALQNLQVNGGGCFSVALDVGDGAQVTSQQDLVVLNDAGGGCQIFSDGFESGDTTLWSKTVP